MYFPYSAAVALFDFVPVLVAGFGLCLLARAIAARHPQLAVIAWTAALLIPFGGACKAVSKLIAALYQQHIGWLENLLFIAMAPGFVAIAFCMQRANAAWRSGLATDVATCSQRRLLAYLSVPLAGALILALSAPQTRLWFFWLLAITTIANAALIFHAIAACRRLGQRRAALLLAYNFVATLALSGLSRLPPSESAAWLQETLNFSAQAALAIGFWQLGRQMKESFAS